MGYENYYNLRAGHYNDASTRRETEHRTNADKRKILDSKSAMLINMSYSDGLRQKFLIADTEDVKMPVFDKKPEPEQQNKKNPFLLLAGITLALSAAVAGTAKIANFVAKSKLKVPNLENFSDLQKMVKDLSLKNNYKNFSNNTQNQIPDIGRNMNLNTEEFFVAYMTLRTPDIKNFVSAAAFFAFSATGLILKNFVDGFKDVWIKKREADINKDFRDNLIEVETQAFQGKNEIIGAMMADTLKKAERMKKQSFAAKTPEKQPAENEKAPSFFEKHKDFLIGAGTVAFSVLCGISAYKDIKKLNEFIGATHESIMSKITALIEKTSATTVSPENKNLIADVLKMYNFKYDFAKKILAKINAPADMTENVLRALERSNEVFTETPGALGGTVGKLQYYSYNDDAKGHFYNWMMNLDSKPLGMLSAVITAVSGLGYVGNACAEAIKDVEVKKANAETDLNLQKRLVETELKNFYSKKQSVVAPLLRTLEKTAKSNDKKAFNETLESVLAEIKNGPPFVYA